MRVNGFASAGTAVLLEDADVVLERLVRAIERVAELEALEDHVLGPRLVGVAELRVDRAADRPDAPGRRSIQMTMRSSSPTSSTPTSVRSAYRPSREFASSTGIQSRLVSGFKNMFSFLFSRGSAEEHVARYVIREHDRGRSLNEILEDKYVQNRLTPEQQRRLLDRPGDHRGVLRRHARGREGLAVDQPSPS